MKTLSIWNVPPQRIKSTKIRLDQLYIHKKTEKELHVACLYNLPSYRCGIIGWCVSYLCHFLPKTYLFASLFKKYRPEFRWIDDAHILSKSISYANSMIPILNIGTWNTKKHFLNFNRENSIFKYGGENNKSMGNLLSSLYYPFYDSGVAIVSNVPASASEFVCFDDDEQLNRGILWSYFDTFQTLIMTISTEGRFISTKKSDTEMTKLMTLQKTLSQKFTCKNTYIIGDFKREIMNFEHETFQIKSVDSPHSPNAYLIHDSRYPVVNDNFVKIISTMILSPINLKQIVQIQPSPPPSSPTFSSPTFSLPTPHCEESITMSPITEEEVEEKKPTIIKEQENDVIIKKEETNKGILSSMIFNYFSKTPPSNSPPSQSPPSQSPKSDDGWSKV